MQQFDLSLWLQDKSRKVCTRDGREVEILKTDFRGYKQIIGVVKNRDNKDDEVEQWDGQGNFRGLFGESKCDLFFANEEEDEFETTIISFAHTMFDHLLDINKEVNVKEWKNKLLDLAKKELQPDIDKELDEAYKTRDEVVYLEGYDKGYEDALKDLPKWKKCIGSSGPFIDDFRGEDYLYLKDYVVKVSELFEKLPKEE